MSRTIFAPDTAFFLSYPDFTEFFSEATSVVHLDIVYPVLYRLNKYTSVSFGRTQERARNAQNAIKNITNLQRDPIGDIELEIYKPEDMVTSLDHESQIVDHVIRLATQHHPGDRIVFVSSDEGVAAVLFHREQKRRGLDNISIETAEKLKANLPLYATPQVRLEAMTINPIPTTQSGKRGLECFLSFIVEDLKRSRLQISIHSARGGKPVAYANVDVRAALYKQDRLRLFVPYMALGVNPRRHGSGQNTKVKLIVWNLGKQLLTEERGISFLLGRHYLTTMTAT